MDGEPCDAGLTREEWQRGQDSRKGAEARREGTQGRRFWVELSDWSAEQRFPANGATRTGPLICANGR
jgi:hypothetical protein